MKRTFKHQTNRLISISAALILMMGMMIVAACKKEEAKPEPVDPNLDKYVVSDLRVLTTKGDTLKSIVSFTKVSETESNLDAIVPDDGNSGKRFKIQFVYPTGINPTSVTPSITDSIDFSIAKTFSFVFTDKVTKKYTVNIIEQAPQAPKIETFVISGAQQTVIDHDKSVIDVRVAQGTNVSAITPTITISPNTATVSSNTQGLNFTNNQTVTVRNGALSKTYLVRITDYGFTKVTALADYTLAANKRPTAFLAASETSLAFDATGNSLFIAYKDGIKKYDLTNPTASPTDMNMNIDATNKAPTKVLQAVDNFLFSCNNPWQAGSVEVCVWTNGTGAPKRIVNIPVPTNAIIQNFHVKKDGSNYVMYFVNRDPLRKSPKADPIMYAANVPAANLTSGTAITAFSSTQNFVGLAAAGIADGPNIELAPIPNSTDFFYNSGTIPPTYVSSTLNNPVWFSSALVNGSSVGVKAFEFNRGKYLMYGVFTWSTNLANPKASKFVLFDVTKKGYKQTILDVNAEFGSTPIQYTTWNSIQKIDSGVGGQEPSAGDFYCQTAYAVTSGGKLRVACLVAGNGFVVYDCE
jgi:hypothetical protein